MPFSLPLTLIVLIPTTTVCCIFDFLVYVSFDVNILIAIYLTVSPLFPTFFLPLLLVITIYLSPLKSN